MGNFTYTTGIPNGPNNPSNDQPIMQTNTNSINSIFKIDHFGFNNAAAQGGWHQQSTYPQVAAAPTTASGQLALYSKAGTSGSALFMVRDNVGATEVALTSSAIAAPVRTALGYTWLPGNLLLQWGFTALINPGATTITFQQAFASVAGFGPIVTFAPFASAPTSSTGNVYISGTNNINFVVQNTDKSGQVINLYWHAIGPI